MYNKIKHKVNVDDAMKAWCINNEGEKQWKYTYLGELNNNTSKIYNNHITHDTEIVFTQTADEDPILSYCTNKSSMIKVRINASGIPTFRGSMRLYLSSNTTFNEAKQTFLEVIGIAEDDPIHRTGAMIDEFNTNKIFEDDDKINELMYVS